MSQASLAWSEHELFDEVRALELAVLETTRTDARSWRVRGEEDAGRDHPSREEDAERRLQARRRGRAALDGPLRLTQPPVSRGKSLSAAPAGARFRRRKLWYTAGRGALAWPRSSAG
jgi:hypothetical protein